LEERIDVNSVGSVISAEFPNKDEDPKLFEIVRKNIIHGPYRILIRDVRVEGKCSKHLPKKYVSETKTGLDGYLRYRRKAPNKGGLSFKMMIDGKLYEVTNQWVVPYCPVLSRLFGVHINVEYLLLFCQINKIQFCEIINEIFFCKIGSVRRILAILKNLHPSATLPTS